MFAGGAEAQEEGLRDETERWVPSFSIYAGVLFQDSDAIANADSPPEEDADSGIICPQPVVPGCTAWPGDLPQEFPGLFGEAIRSKFDVDPDNPNLSLISPIGAAIDDDLLVTPFVLGSVEIMTPGLQFLPTRPRFFVRGDAGGSFAFTRDIAREGEPGNLEIPEPRPNEPVFAPEIRGQGSTTKAEVKPFIVSAGAGIAFTLQWGERRIRVKPSVEYLREEIEITGIVNSAIPLTNPLMGSQDPENEYRLISLNDSTEEVYHGLGPGLEIEMDTMRTGPFVLAVYISGQAYNFFGDLQTDLSDQNEFNERAEWSFEKERWGYRAGVGLRFRFLPEGDGWF